MCDTFSLYKEKLPTYLSIYGINLNVNTSGKCPLKQHKSPSPFRLGQGTSGLVWFCFACGTGGSIFDLAHELHGYPPPGSPDFYDITLRHLSDTLNLPFPKKEKKELSFDEKYKNILYSATREIYNNLSRNNIKEYTTNRGWNKKTLKKFNIGSIEDYGAFIEYMKTKYSFKVLNAVGLLSRHSSIPSMFQENRIVFPIHDSKGRPVGFTARSLEDKEIKRKYVNSPNSPIFRKSNVLYNIHLAINSIKRYDSRILYVVEGQADVITLTQAGIHAVVALSGTSSTEEHLELIKDFDNVVLVLDPDTAGSKATRKMYVKYKKRFNKDLFIKMMPEGYDPDEYVKKFGIDSFKEKLLNIIPMEWEINKTKDLTGNVSAEFWLKKIVKVNTLFHKSLLKALSLQSSVKLPDLNRRLNVLLLEEIQNMFGSIIGSGKVNMNINIERNN